MRCKKHSTDLSSIDGVCASCLRERLIKVILAQEQSDAQLQAQNHSNSNTNPPFPRTVSPYISHRKSDNPANPVVGVQRPHNKPYLNHSNSDQRFYNSPQIAVNTGGCIGGTSSNKKTKSLIRFYSFSNLFRSNGRDGDTDSNHRASISTSGEPSGAAGKPTSVTSSPLWYSNALPGAGSRQKNKSFHVNDSSTTAASSGVRKQRCVRDRGMSPARSSDGGENEFSDGSSGYESEESFKQTPKKTPSHQTGRRRGGQRSVSEMLFCLSPLVRASPNRLWSMKGKPPLDGVFSGDNRLPAVPHLANAKSFCANRSRKLADFGRSGPNR
ncbi:hypothetical protein L1987_39187 [Smallanthus sonchifolius]|uniref:Uncharacterized protein n=1 Tax=Smallanthus sonchifolius TaxID=185202 RepID=A0ACB9HL46_9ASTR|nr:hypothetical protein L1987_39187 [Smallanthus sonchifolius]